MKSEVRPDTISRGFKILSRKKNAMFTTVKAQISVSKRTYDMESTVKLYLDNDTGAVLYPVEIGSPVPGLTVTLDSDSSSSCSFPPSIPDATIDSTAMFLSIFHETIGTVRELIRKEQQRILQKGV